MTADPCASNRDIRIMKSARDDDDNDDQDNLTTTMSVTMTAKVTTTSDGDVSENS